MGADLVGFMVIAPRKIDKKRLRRIETAVQRIQKQWDRKVIVCSGCGKRISLGPKGVCGVVCDYCGQSMERPDPARVTYLLSDWPPDHRDTVVRMHPDSPTEVLIFAGDQTWGDPPSGEGYETLLALQNMGLWKAVGIR